MKKKYTIEGNVDFFAELYKSLDVNEDTNKNESDNNLCLISKLPLTEKFIQLTCGHKFNYIPLYNDIVNHKLKFNNMESTQSHLKINQIRCPYCRTVQNDLLPYYDDIPGVKKLHKVNYVDLDIVNNENIVPNSYMSSTGHCTYNYVSPNFNPDLPESTQNPKQICCNKFTYLYSIIDDNNKYCYEHLRIVKKANVLAEKDKIKKSTADVKQKEKQEKLKAKQDAKQKEKEEKLLAKQKEKQEKQKEQKETTIDNTETNTVIGIMDLQNTSSNVCVQITKSGQHKGTQCGVKSVCNNLCKRHYNLQNKHITINDDK
jgi:hypothetical protein